VADAVSQLIREAVLEAEVDRRIRQRYPFFRPAKIALDDAQPISRSAFCRDISPTGVGLLHDFPLENREVVVAVTTDAGRSVSLRIDIMWCKPCGEGWYMSGGRFVAS
jgi:hypothetical protein